MINKNNLPNIRHKISILIPAIFMVLFPVLFIVLINGQYKKIIRTPESYYENTGVVDDFGMTTKIYRGGKAASKTPVFFVKIKNSHIIFSYSQSLFNRNYEEIINKLKKGDSVRIYHEGFDKRQNTVNIIQLEKNDTVIISKTSFNNKEAILLIWFCLFLLIFLLIIYMFVKYGHWRRKIK